MPPYELGVLGSTGLKESGGWIYEEFLPKLRQPLGLKTYQEMRDNSSVIGALLYAIRNLILQAEWRVEPAEDSADAREQAEFVEGALEDMSHTWEEFLTEVLSMLWAGWAYFEIVYKLRRGPENRDPRRRSKHDDGRVGWRKFSLRAQDTLDRWEFDDEDGGLRGMWQYSMYGANREPVLIPIEKALLFRTEAHKGNPEGRVLLRNAVVDYHNVKRAQQIELVGVERDMTGVIAMQVPKEMLLQNADSDDVALRNDIARMLGALKRDEREFVMVPSEVDEDGKPTGFKLQLLSSGGRRQIDTNALINRLNRQILMSVLAEVLMLGTETGSWSLASSKTRLLSMGIGAIMDAIASVFNRFAIPRLMALNGVAHGLHPWIAHGDIETPPLDEFGKYITALSTAGIALPAAAERKALEVGGLPLPEVTEGDIDLPGEGEAQPDDEDEDDDA